MKLRLTKIFAAFLVSFVIAGGSAFAGKIPTDMQLYLKKEVPKSKVRFDGVLVYPDGTIYLPVFPSYPLKPESVGVKTVHPKGASLVSKPELFVLSNNYSYMRLDKGQDGKLRVANPKNFPQEIITGIIPQDLIVPKGLILPDDLKSLLGNLQIPLSTDIKIVAPKTQAAVQKQSIVQVPAPLKNKIYYVSDFDSPYVSVFSAGASNPQFDLKLPNIPSDIKVDNTGQFIIVACRVQNYLDVLDASSQMVLRQIEIGVPADEIIVSKDNLAYVVSTAAASIFVVDLNTMKVMQKINAKGMPQKLSISDDERKLVYYDKSSSKIFCIELDNSYAVREVISVPNVSKVLFHKGNIYAVSRTDNKLVIVNYYAINFDHDSEIRKASVMTLMLQQDALKNFNMFKGEKTKTIMDDVMEKPEIPKIVLETAQKPVDMMISADKVYVLCAGENKISIFDTIKTEPVATYKLPVSGFSKAFVPVRNSNLVLITNVLEKKYLVFDKSKNVVTGSYNTNIPMKSLVIAEKMVKPKL